MSQSKTGFRHRHGGRPSWLSFLLCHGSANPRSKYPLMFFFFLIPHKTQKQKKSKSCPRMETYLPIIMQHHYGKCTASTEKRKSKTPLDARNNHASGVSLDLISWVRLSYTLEMWCVLWLELHYYEQLNEKLGMLGQSSANCPWQCHPRHGRQKGNSGSRGFPT